MSGAPDRRKRRCPAAGHRAEPVRLVERLEPAAGTDDIGALQAEVQRGPLLMFPGRAAGLVEHLPTPSWNCSSAAST